MPTSVPSPGWYELRDVLITEQLLARHSRPAQLAAENDALHRLARQLAGEPVALLNTLVECALDLCCPKGTSGVSLLETASTGEQVFRWVALAGRLKDHIGGTTPRHHSPCGTCLDRGAPQLYRLPERFFAYFTQARPVIYEGLVIPFYAGPSAGTIWVVSHDNQRPFDAEDVRIMTRLADFTAAAFRLHIDRRERDKAQAEAEAANRGKDQFLATLAHELRQPLAPIFTALELMKRRVSQAVGEHSRQVIERQARQLSRLVEDLFDAARIAQGKIELRRQLVDLRAIVADTLPVVAPQIEARRQSLNVSVPDHPLWIEADPVRMQQVLSNLLFNAAKFTGDGGTIHVTAERDDDRTAHLTVRDSGRGIAPEMLPHVFELFRQGNTGEGLGVGLAVVRGLVEQHGGGVQARSVGLGCGSEFSVSLPLVRT